MKKVLTIVIGFVHDFAAGCWGATVLAIYWLTMQSLPPGLELAVASLKKQFFWFGIACVVAVFATGAGRTFTYVGNVYGADAERVRRKMLIIKHILLFLVFGTGIYWQYLMTFR